jgi:hypothetical protein
MATDEMLVKRAQGGDLTAYGELAARYQDRVYGLCARLLATTEDTRDATQEIFIKIFRALPGFDLRADFATWLYRIANFGAISSLTWLWKLSPLLLVGIGAEYFLKRQLNRDPEIEVRFSVVSLLLVIVLILVSGMVSTGGSFLGSLGQSYTRTWDSQPLEIKDGDQLVVENPFGRIDLTPASGTALSVRALIHSPASGPTREQADQAVVDVEQIGNQIFVRVPSPSSLVTLGSLNSISYDLEIKTPATIDASLTSSAGAVTASDLQDNLDVRAKAGKVELNRIGGNIAVQSETGLVQIIDPGGDVTGGIASGYPGVLVQPSPGW